jgi:predicted DNA binding CopG/RHH family protein
MSKEHTYNLRLSEADRIAFKGAASIAGMPLAEWLRMLGREEARRAAGNQGQDTKHE